MTALAIILVLLLPLMLVAGFYGGRLWADRQAPQLPKLREQVKLLRKENDRLQNDVLLNQWSQQDLARAKQQVERYKKAAASHELQPVPEFALVKFTEHFCGNATRLAESIKDTLPGVVQNAKVRVHREYERRHQEEIMSLSGSPEKLGQDVKAFLVGKQVEDNVFQVTIEGTYRKVNVLPAVHEMIVIETIKEPVLVPVPQSLPLEVQEFLDRYPAGERLRMLEAAEFRTLEQHQEVGV